MQNKLQQTSNDLVALKSKAAKQEKMTKSILTP